MVAHALLAAAAPAATATDDIRNAAGLASLTLALIGFFTTLRVNALRDKPIGGLSWSVFGVFVLPEIVLLLVALIALIAMAPLLDAFQLDQLGHGAGAIPTLFALIWFGFAAIAAVELSFIVSRMAEAIGNRTTR